MATIPSPYGTKGYERPYNGIDRTETVAATSVKRFDTILVPSMVRSGVTVQSVVVRVRLWHEGGVVLDLTDGTTLGPIPLDGAVTRVIYTEGMVKEK